MSRCFPTYIHTIDTQEAVALLIAELTEGTPAKFGAAMKETVKCGMLRAVAREFGVHGNVISRLAYNLACKLHGFGTVGNAHVKAISELLIRRPHYIGMAGMNGCSPNYSEVFTTRTDAAQTLADVHGRGRKWMRKLRRDYFRTLRSRYDENDYAEIQACCCAEPWVHQNGQTRAQFIAERGGEFGAGLKGAESQMVNTHAHHSQRQFES